MGWQVPRRVCQPGRAPGQKTGVLKEKHESARQGRAPWRHPAAKLCAFLLQLHSSPHEAGPSRAHSPTSGPLLVPRLLPGEPFLSVPARSHTSFEILSVKLDLLLFPPLVTGGRAALPSESEGSGWVASPGTLGTQCPYLCPQQVPKACR